jgi:hypothetical protein
MKTRTLFIGFLAMSFIIFICSNCNPKTEDIAKIENTLKSVSFFYDSAGVNPSTLLASMERMNKAIDSIGYPDAGYKVWIVQSDTFKEYQFMIEGYWPDQAVYDLIHNHELYKNANNKIEQEDEELWKNLNNISYNRFILVEK